jgi:hypothetical protein
MSVDPDDQLASVAINESLVVRELRRAEPLRTTLARLLNRHTDEHSTTWCLGRLPTGWHVFHDRLVVCSGGVFTVDAKNLNGKVWVASRSIRHNGHPTDYLSKAVAEALRSSRLLSAAVGHGIHVRPVLAILADGWTIREMPPDVYVGAPRGVKNWMLHQPVVLTSSQIATICSAAAKSTTWQG